MLSEHPRFKNPFLLWQVGALLVLAIAGTAYRTIDNYSPPSKEFNWHARGHSDFHYGTYLPSKAFRERVNPYTSEFREKYSAARETPPYSPFVFFLHLPFSLLDLETANIAFFVYNLSLMFALAFCAFRFSGGKRFSVWLTIVLLLLLSRPAHQSLFTGYFTVEMAIGTGIALHFARTLPWVAGLGILLTSSKPTFVIPLLLLMLFRQDFRAVIWGFCLCAITASAGLLWIANGDSLFDVLDSIRAAQDIHEGDKMSQPFFSWTRTDILGVVSKPLRANPGAVVALSSMLVMLIPIGFSLRRLAARSVENGAAGLGGLIATLFILVGFYHHTYDALILLFPWVGLVFFGPRIYGDLSPRIRHLLALLLSVPAVNYAATLFVKGKLDLADGNVFWIAITMLNGICLAIALAIAVFQALRHPIEGSNQTLPDNVPST